MLHAEVKNASKQMVGRRKKLHWGVDLAIIATVAILAALLFQASTSSSAYAAPSDNYYLFDFAGKIRKGNVSVNGANVQESGGVLRVNAAANQTAYITFSPNNSLLGAGSWNLSDYALTEIVVRNSGTKSARVRCMLASDGYNDWSNSSFLEGFIPSGQVKTLRVYLYRETISQAKHPELLVFDECARLGLYKAMYGLPGGFQTHWHNVDASEIRFLRMTLFSTDVDQRLEILSISGAKYIVPAEMKEKGNAFFPFIDQFGQYKHADWPGKTHDESDLKRAAESEAKDLSERPGPKEFNKYGGWTKGPKLRATGSFRTEKIGAYWWLVDPDGKLFWSFGSNCLNVRGGGTFVDRRENYFEGLPKDNSPLAKYYLNGGVKRFEFLSANRCRKYGENWDKTVADLDLRRLRSWGMNTVGAWSDNTAYLAGKAAYTKIIEPRVADLQYHCPDPFDDELRSALKASFAEEKETTAKDPWCIGYFVYNERDFSDINLLYQRVMIRPATTTAAKRALIEDLKAKYRTISALNDAWGSSFASWDSMAVGNESYNQSAARNDAADFYRHYIEKFYEVCRSELKAVAPDKLYLGSRFHKHNDDIIASAGKYCDVISYNLYRDDLSGFRLNIVDKPIMATEFSFGALDRGMFWTGLGPASDQEDRAGLFKQYVMSALQNPQFVGAHWFCWASPSATGREDGENGQIGMIDFCDSPYVETVRATRELGDAIYRVRVERAKADLR